jgi:CheY-like chemotaxis protein
MTEVPATVFVIEDDPSMRAAVMDLVRSVRLQGQAFASPQEFLESHLPDTPGCMVLDVRLPGMSGLTLHNELVEAGVTLPVIFITGHGDIPMCARVSDEAISPPGVARRDTRGDRARSGLASGDGAHHGAAEALRHPDRARAPNHDARRDRAREQADRGRAQFKRDHREGSSRASHAEDASGVTARARAYGGPAGRAHHNGIDVPHYTSVHHSRTCVQWLYAAQT